MMNEDSKNAFRDACNGAFELLPEKLDTKEARLLMLAIALQESRMVHRKQIDGPAKGFWQFEEGTRASRGGVWGVMLHTASRRLLQEFCEELGVPFDAEEIYDMLEHNDVLAAGVARLLLLTDARKLPGPNEQQAAWDYYLRNWRPGKPHPQTWPDLYEEAMEFMEGEDD